VSNHSFLSEALCKPSLVIISLVISFVALSHLQISLQPYLCTFSSHPSNVLGSHVNAITFSPWISIISIVKTNAESPGILEGDPRSPQANHWVCIAPTYLPQPLAASRNLLADGAIRAMACLNSGRSIHLRRPIVVGNHGRLK
jgi:hypothetical protein